VLSDLHADHVGGLPGLLAGWRVGAVEVGPLAEPGVGGGRVRTWAAAARVPVRSLHAGTRFRIGSAAVTVLGPVGIPHGSASDPNGDSLVLRVVDAGVTLLTGDVGSEAQRALVASGAPLRADVLKVAHHGAADQDPTFLVATRARVAVISVGAHTAYSEPADTTVAALTAAGMRVLRTDRDGDVAVVVRGGGLGVVRHRRGVPPAMAVAAGRPEPGRCPQTGWSATPAAAEARLQSIAEVRRAGSGELPHARAPPRLRGTASSGTASSGTASSGRPVRCSSDGPIRRAGNRDARHR
jgi:competence protein ComEC